MKQFMTISVLMFILCFFAPVSSLAVSVENIGTVFQSNLCFECESLEQANLSIVTQNIKLGPYWFISNNRFLIIDTLLNVASVDQYNFCEDCNDVEQRNSSAVIQNIDLPKASMANHRTPVTGVADGIISNIAGTVQSNICEQCQFNGLVNSGIVTQNITLLAPFISDPSATPAGFPLSIFSNFATISQFNFCKMCDGVFQGNLSLIVQNISAAPEPGTIFLLGSGLAGLGLLRLARKKLFQQNF